MKAKSVLLGAGLLLLSLWLLIDELRHGHARGHVAWAIARDDTVDGGVCRSENLEFGTRLVEMGTMDQSIYFRT